MSASEKPAMTQAEPVPVRGPGGGRWRWIVAAALLTVCAAVLAAALTGASAPTLVADPGALVRWAAPVLGALVQLAQAVVTGGLVFLALILPLPHRAESSPWRLVRTVVSVAAPVWALVTVVDLVVGYAVVAGRGLGGAGFGDELGFYLTQIETGRSGLLIAVLVALTAVACAAISGYRSALLALLLAIAAVLPAASQGHASGTNNHDLGMTALFGHVVGAAIWTGGLLVLAVIGSRLGTTAPEVARRFSAVALWCFAIVVASGIAAAVIRVGAPAQMLTPYGAVLGAKIAAFIGLGWAGWLHRRRTIARLRTGRGMLFWRLIVVEIALVALASGAGVALAASAPPVPQEPVGELSATEIVSSRPPPPEPTADAIATAFYPDLFFGFVAIAMMAVYWGWVLRLRRRGDHWSLGRSVAWTAGTVVFGYLVLGAPAVYGYVLLSAHMAAHMAFVMVVPILLVSGAPVTLALRALPKRRDGSRGPREWLLGLVHSRWGRFMATPVVAAALFIITMVAFYFSPLLYLAATSHLGHVLMIVHFTLTGYLFVNALIGIDPGPQRPGYPMRLMLLFATMAAHAFFGLALMNTTELLAADYYGALGLPWGVDALADQRDAGEIAWGIGEIPAVAIAVVLAIRWSRDDERLARRTDRAADRDGDADLAAYNAMLAGLAAADRSEPER
ncbi:MAG: cytochrome c oxidase assembly protein [Beutenbergiaceae bacterium]